jgi:hypothetical protein
MPDGCNLCRADLRERIELSDLRGLRGSGTKCVACGSRAHMRTFGLAVEEHVRHRIAAPKAALAAVQVGGATPTRRVLAAHFGAVGEAAWPEGAAGPALEPRPGGLHLVAGVRLTPEQDPRALLDAAAAALQAGGLALVHVDLRRLETEGDRPLLEHMAAAGLAGALLDYRDPFTDLATPWLLGRRVRADGVAEPPGP